MLKKKIPLIYEKESYLLRGIWIDIHKTLGPSHTEATYGNAFEKVLKDKNIPYKREPHFSLSFNGQKVGNYRPDFVVFDKIIVEFKSLPYMSDVFVQKVDRYLAVSNYKLAFIVNFGESKTHIIRRIHDRAKPTPRAQRNLRALSGQNGFTALEMLLASAIIVLLLGAGVIVGFRDQPAKNRNAERRNEVSAIADALAQWSLDNSTPFGAISPALPLTANCIGTTSCYDLSFLTPAYLNKIPEDPKNTSGQADTGYTIYKDTATKEIIIGAPEAELEETIEARRK